MTAANANAADRLVLITGASGFVGRTLTPVLQRAGWRVRRGVRHAHADDEASIGDFATPDQTLLTRAAQGCDAVVHLAALAHVKAAPQAHEAINARGAEAMIAAARAAGARRFILMSSVKAAADFSAADCALTERDAATPQTPYGRAKLFAENAALAADDLRPVCLRPPLVHGPQARANFARLLRLAKSPWPLPFAGISARRSLIATASLAQAVLNVLDKPQGPAGVFYVADEPALTVGEMIAAMRAAWGRHAGLAPGWPLAAAGRMLGPLGPLAPLTTPHIVSPAAFQAAYGAFSAGDAATLVTQTARAWSEAP
jgi:UDP-glucose 4-epimerase